MAAVASLGLLFAACDDDNGGNDMSADMAVSTDLSTTNMDMTATPDLNPGPGTAQLTIADVEGTYPVGPAPFSHLLFTTQSIPEQAGATHQKDNRMPGPGALSGFLFGCTADYYNGSTTFPPSATNAGELTYKGYSTALYSADSRSAGSAYPPPIPDTIKCDFVDLGGGIGTYVCGYGDVSGDGGVASVMGEDPSSVLFPPLPQVAAACPYAGSTPTPGAAFCEQHPIVPGPAAMGGTPITETLAGNGTYTAAVSRVVEAAKAVTVLTVDSTGTPAAPANPFEPFAGVKLDGSHAITITWNCSDKTKPAGDNCSPTSFTGLIVLSNATQGLPMGVAQCVMPSKNPAGSPGTITLPKDYITTILGGSTSGSALVLLAQLNGNPTFSGGHEVVATAGQGYFAFLPKQ